MDLGNLKIRIDFGIDGKKIVFVAEEVEEGAKVTMHLGILYGSEPFD